MYYKTRNCPLCNKELKYSCVSSYCLATTHNANCRNCATKQYAKRIGDCSFLLDDTSEAYYWVGFCLADGHFRNGRLLVTLSIKDLEHLKILADKLNITVNLTIKTQCKLAIMHLEIIEKLCKKFDIQQVKTYNPPNISIFSQIPKNLLLALFAGFIDGDGNIQMLQYRKDCNLRIKCHSSWIKILEFFRDNFLNNNSSVKINASGYAQLICSDSVILKELKSKVLELAIPVMERKWNKINMEHIGKTELSKIRIKKVKELLVLRKSKKDIQKELGISCSGLSMLIKRNNLKNE